MSHRDETGPPAFSPFADDATVEQVGALTIENGTACIAVHGSLDLTRDRRGLAHARRLRSAFDAIVSVLEALPADAHQAERDGSDATRPPRDVPNPFA